MGTSDFLCGALLSVMLVGPAAAADGVSPEALESMDACLVESATGRDVANTTIICFNEARGACHGAVLACEEEMTAAVAKRADGLMERMPSELEGVPEFAKDRYLEILDDIEAGAVDLCADVPEAGQISCAYRAEALRFAKLRSLASQIDPRFLIP
ncbi:hypothetical protein [Aliiruegeria sabulilitoris]|uniref:hypothetical protein n=1 Tax=Aliiruegeria sabulilitoris TaxID=1510458 RepID=UPI000835F819|nr:hypothetical protein [Aliiruegeria sabulilitoris]NDR56414.1 hypothetical protein [Pseudoruegeria sp. M32A2M]